VATGRHAKGSLSVGSVSSEVCDAMVELVSPVCAAAAEAADVLALMRDELAAEGVELLAAGVHPDAAFGDVRPGPGERHVRSFAALGGVIERTSDTQTPPRDTAA
jgi:gamma-glutamyl:cysteine ligase YbdK (ATP-grasp superfamily)